MRTVSVPVSISRPYRGKGIQYNPNDRAHAYRVWHGGKIVQFTYTLNSAIAVQNLVDTYGVGVIDEAYEKWKTPVDEMWALIVQEKFMEETSA